MPAKSIIGILSIALGAVLLVTQDVQAQLTKSSRLEGDRYTTARTLADSVEDGARYVLDESRRTLGSPQGRQHALVNSLSSFLEAASALRQRIESRPDQVNAIDAQVRRLQTAAARNATRLRGEGELRGLVDEWNRVTSDLADLRRVVAGNSVAVRPRDTARTGGDDYGDDVLAARDKEQFRQLARELEAESRRVLAVAERDRRRYGVRGEQLVADLRIFANRAGALQRHADADVLRPRQVGPALAGVAADARRVDETLRLGSTLQPMRAEWARSLRLLDDMTDLLRDPDQRGRLRGDDRRDEIQWPRTDDAAQDDFADAALSRSDLERFRALSHDLDTVARRVLDRAERDLPTYGVRGNQLITDLRAFVSRTGGVHRHADADVLRPRDVGPNVAALLVEARRVDGTLGMSTAFRPLATDWARTVQVLEEMRGLLR